MGGCTECKEGYHQALVIWPWVSVLVGASPHLMAVEWMDWVAAPVNSPRSWDPMGWMSAPISGVYWGPKVGVVSTWAEVNHV